MTRSKTRSLRARLGTPARAFLALIGVVHTALLVRGLVHFATAGYERLPSGLWRNGLGMNLPLLARPIDWHIVWHVLPAILCMSGTYVLVIEGFVAPRFHRLFGFAVLAAYAGMLAVGILGIVHIFKGAFFWYLLVQAIWIFAFVWGCYWTAVRGVRDGHRFFADSLLVVTLGQLINMTIIAIGHWAGSSISDEATIYIDTTIATVVWFAYARRSPFVTRVFAKEQVVDAELAGAE